MAWSSGTDLRDEKGVYHWKDREFVSVTKVLDHFLSGRVAYAYAAWVANRAVELATLARDGEVAQVPVRAFDDDLNPYWTTEDKNPMDLLLDAEHLRNEAPRKSYAAADRGTCCHLLLDAWRNEEVYALSDVGYWTEHTIIDRGLRCSPDEALPYCLVLMKWLMTYNPQVVAADCPVFHDKLKYAGTLDAIMGVGERLYLVDFKTSTQTSVGHACQVAAYRYAEYAGKASEQRRVRMPKVDDCAVLLIDGKEQRATFRAFPNVKRDFETFKLLLWAYRRVNERFSADTKKDLGAKIEAEDLMGCFGPRGGEE